MRLNFSVQKQISAHHAHLESKYRVINYKSMLPITESSLNKVSLMQI